MRLMLSCKDATRAVSEGLDHELPLVRRLSLRLHVAMCGFCRAYARQVRTLDALVRQRFRDGPPPPPEQTPPVLPPEARQRLEAAIAASDTPDSDSDSDP